MATEYWLIPAEEDEAVEGAEAHGSDVLLPNSKTAFTAQSSSLIWLFLHLLVTASFLMALRVQTHTAKLESCPMILPLELSLAAEALEYETVIIQPSGFGKLFGIDGPVTPYEGFPTPDIDARWHNLSSAGMFSLTESQNLELFGAPPRTLTADAPYGPPGMPVVQIEVFHQLHCLNYIRHRVYNQTPEDPGGEGSINIHTAHCIDYLRQVLMCHGDVHPITHFYRETKLRNFWPNFTVPHTCRNFDKIVEWAETGSLSGMTIE